MALFSETLADASIVFPFNEKIDAARSLVTENLAVANCAAVLSQSEDVTHALANNPDLLDDAMVIKLEQVLNQVKALKQPQAVLDKARSLFDTYFTFVVDDGAQRGSAVAEKFVYVVSLVKTCTNKFDEIPGVRHVDALKDLVTLSRFASSDILTPETGWTQQCEQDSEIIARNNALVTAAFRTAEIKVLKDDEFAGKLDATFAATVEKSQHKLAKLVIWR